LWAPVGYRTGNEWEDPLKMGVEERDRKGYINAYGLSRKHIFDSVDSVDARRVSFNKNYKQKILT
jgi:hypothetical protein